MDSQQHKPMNSKNSENQNLENDVLYIKGSTVINLLNWNDCVDAMESALMAIPNSSQEAINQPFSTQTPRTFTNVANKGVLLTMPGYASNYALNTVTGNEKRHSTLACKLVTAFNGNSQLDPPLPSILATILLFDPETGKLKAIVDGTDITAWRTASVSVVATKHLYFKHNSMVSNGQLAIVGTGTQGRIHALAMLNYFPYFFTRVKLWNRTRARAEKLREELREFFPETEITVATTSVECVTDADCIVTATYSSQQLFELKDLKENVHINAIGAGTNHHSELSTDIYQSASMYIESNVGIQTELKGIEQYINCEIGEIIIGQKDYERSKDGRNITVFQSIGNSIEDGIMANLIYQKFIKL